MTGLGGAPTARAETRRSPGAPAKSVILFWLSGGVSHIDTWDMKPDAPAEYRGEFKSISTSAPGVRLCEHFPLLSRQAHHLAVVNSLGHYGRGTGDHHAGYYYNLTGHEPDPSFRQLLNNRRPYTDDWPFIGAIAVSKLPPHPSLPSLIALPQKPGFPEYTRPGQFAARLGPAFDPVYLLGSRDRPMEFTTPALTLEGDVDAARLQSRRRLLEAVDGAVRQAERMPAQLSQQQERAFSLLCASQTRAAFDLEKEPAAVRDRYGATINGMSLLLARRLVEAGTPFIAVYWMEDPKLDPSCKSGGGWDTHGNNFGCLRNYLLPEFDRCFSALLEDLDARCLLEQTLVLVTSEMGRTPKIGDPRSGGAGGGGRDHWTNCMSVLLAGGGVRGGQMYGSSDKIGAYPADKPTAPEDVACTVYHALGISEKTAVDREGRPFDAIPDGRALTELF
ncbi:MAG TPA: DUF1501 domain-containing protein [Gemmataceae bacterium]|nr:DUF1501 domain-containing protein [Gemmataceae bacterium]